MLVELGLVEQRYQAVLEVLNDGATVTDVARRSGVARQTVQAWLRSYAAEGLRGLADRSSRPRSYPHQMPPELEARIVEMRRTHPGWGPRTILYWLEQEGTSPLPGRTSVERCLVRHGLVTPGPAPSACSRDVARVTTRAARCATPWRRPWPPTGCPR